MREGPSASLSPASLAEPIGTPSPLAQEMITPQIKQQEHTVSRDRSESAPVQPNAARVDCSECFADISAYKFFYMVFEPHRYICRDCYESESRDPGRKERCRKYQFIWHGTRQDVDIWIDPSPLFYDSALISAVKQEDTKSISALCRKADIVNKIDSEGLSPLHVAAYLGLQKSARCLLLHGANTRLQDRNDNTPLSQAIYSKQKDMVRVLLDGGASMEGRGPLDNSPLHVACLTDSSDIVKILLERPEAIHYIDVKGFSGKSALWISLENGNLDLAKLLLKAGANPNVTNDGETLLGKLAASNGIDGLKLLLSYGVDPDGLDKHSKPALFHAAWSGTDEVCLALLEGGASIHTRAENGKKTILGQAIFAGRLSTVKLLLNKGAEIEENDGLYRTPLAVAAMSGQLDICTYLLSVGANPNPTWSYFSDDCTVNLPLLAALRWTIPRLQTIRWTSVWRTKLQSICQLLEKSNAKIDVRKEAALDILYWAIDHEEMELCKIYTEAGADVNAYVQGESLVCIPARKGHIEMVKYLLAEGALAKRPSPTGRWKHFEFDENVSSSTRAEILKEVRAARKEMRLGNH